MNFNPFSSPLSGNIFQTTANTYQNSFQNPMNAANMNPGWGINPNLLTPSFEASYRPQYNGAQPYGDYSRPGFFKSVANLTFRNPPRWGNAVDEDRQSIESISSRPFDSVVWAGQRIGAPILGYGAAFRMLGGPSSTLGRGVGRGFARGFTGAFGGAFEGGLGGALAGGFEAGMGVMGGLAGGLILPAIAGNYAMEGMQKALFNPYINTRRSGRDLRDNFQGVTFSDARGNSVTGQGLGGAESSRIASGITRAGIKDYTFSTGEFANIADYSGRAGLLDDSKSKQIVQRVKDISEQVKLIMALGKDPSIKDAIEELAKLHSAGASLIGGNSSVAATTYSKMSMYASIAGRSVQSVMNTVGAQGQYMYQMNGMTPYLGQLTAGNILGSFESARRAGTFGPAAYARMGGVEGATQSAMSAQVNALQNPLMQMALGNKYLYGGTGGSVPGSGMSVTGVIATAGRQIAKDPTGYAGNMILFGQQLVGKLLDKDGSKGTEDMIASMMKSMSVSPSGAGGKYSAGQEAAFLKSTGISDEEIRAYINLRASQTDPTAYKQNQKAMNASVMQAQRTYITQHRLENDVGGVLGRGIHNTGSSIVESISSIPEAFAHLAGYTSDTTQSVADWWKYGGSFNKGVQVSSMKDFMDSQKTHPDEHIKLLDTNKVQLSDALSRTDIIRTLHSVGNDQVLSRGDAYGAMDIINQMAKRGVKSAQDFTGATTDADRSRALGVLLDKHHDELGRYADVIADRNQDNGNDSYFKKVAKGMQTKEYVVKAGDARGDFQSSLDAVTGKKYDMLKSMKVVGEVDSLWGNHINEDTIEDYLKQDKYRDVAGALSGLSRKDKITRLRTMERTSAFQGVTAIGSLAMSMDTKVADYKAHPELILDDDLRKQFLAANTDTERRKVIAGNVVANAGGKVKTPGLASAMDESVNIDDIRGYEQSNKNYMELSAKNYQAASSGKYDYATYTATQNALDNQKTVSEFGQHVKEFGEKVASIQGKDGASTAPSTPVKDMPNGWNPGNWFKSHNTRDGGTTTPDQSSSTPAPMGPT